MSTKTKIWQILHLSLAFTLIIYLLFYPSLYERLAKMRQASYQAYLQTSAPSTLPSSSLDLPLPLLLFLIGSVLFPIGFLLGKRWASLRFLLPLLTASLYFYPTLPVPSPYPPESALYPYLTSPLSSSILEQKAQLEAALPLYLAARYETTPEEAHYLFIKHLYENPTPDSGWNYQLLSLSLTLWTLLYLILSKRSASVHRRAYPQGSPS